MGRSRFSTLVAESSDSLRAISSSVCASDSGCCENSMGNSSVSKNARFSVDSVPIRVKFSLSSSLYRFASSMPSNDGDDRRRMLSRRLMYSALL